LFSKGIISLVKNHLFVIGIFLLALGLRIIDLPRFPAGFTADEAAQGYTAYSILKTGKDEWGVKFPLNPRSFGDFKAPLQTYLMIPSIAVFGLNEFSVRLPNAVLGSLAVLMVYFLVKELFSPALIRIDPRINPNDLALLSSLFLAISPWHICLSRGAFEANLTTFFLPLAIFLFLKGIHTRGSLFMILSSVIFGLNLFTYHSAKLLSPLIFFPLFFFFRKKFFGQRNNHILIYDSALIIFGIFLGLAGFSFLKGGGTRAGDIGLFSGGWQAVANQRYFATLQGFPDFLARLFNNKLTFILAEFVKNDLSYLSPQFLFTQGAGEATYGMLPGRGVLYLFEMPFVLAAFYSLFKQRSFSLVFLWFWVLLSPISAALARGVGYHANRVAVMTPAIQIISAYGGIKFLQWIKVKFNKNRQIVILSFCYIVILTSFLFFLEDYFFQAPKINAPKMSYGWRQAMDYLNIQKGAEKIIVSRSFSEPQAFVMFYDKIDPKRVHLQTKPWLGYQKSGYFVDQLGSYSLENYEFRNFSFPEDWQRKNIILVGMEKDFLGQEKIIQEKELKGEIKEKKIIPYPDSKVAFDIIGL